MGSSQSKNSSKDGKRSNSGKAPSPYQEKHNSADSKTPLTAHATTSFNFPQRSSQDAIQASPRTSTIIPVQSSNQVQVDDLEGYSNISRPPPPPRLRHLSELIDPAELAMDSQVRSPSGNLLAPEQFLAHPNRPRSIRERQEEIREKLRAASRLGVEAETAEDEKTAVGDGGMKKRKGKRNYLRCGCFGGP